MGTQDADQRNGETSAAVAEAVPVIVGTLAAHGVTDVQWFIAFHGYPVIWLVTTADDEKAAVARHGFFRPEVLAALSDAGVESDLAQRASLTVESEETVDRDFEGNWFYAMR